MTSPCKAFQTSKTLKNQSLFSGEMRNETPSMIQVTPVMMNKRT